MDTQNGADPGGGKYFFASSFPPGYYYGIQRELFNFSKELGLNSSSKFLRSRIKSTRVSGFVLIRLGARAMKFFSRKLLKSEPPRRRGITRDY